MAAPHRNEDHQETDQPSRSDSAVAPGPATQEVKKRIAKKDSGVGFSEGHEVSPASGEQEVNHPEDSQEEARKHSPSSPRVSTESARPRSTPNTTSNFIHSASAPLPTTQNHQAQTILPLSTVDKSFGRKDAKSKPRTMSTVIRTSPALSPFFDEESREEAGNYGF